MTGPEALEWLLNNKNQSPLATNRFRTRQQAIDAVKSLYAAGAIRVELTPLVHDEPSRLEKEGGPYADALMISFPKENAGQILTEIRRLEPEDVDSYNELLTRAGPVITAVLTWD